MKNPLKQMGMTPNPRPRRSLPALLRNAWRVQASVDHQRAALPLHKWIVWVFGAIAALSIGGGIVAVTVDSVASTKLNIFGAELSTSSVGVAFVFIGVVVALLAVRSVLHNQAEIAKIPADKEEIRKALGLTKRDPAGEPGEDEEKA